MRKSPLANVRVEILERCADRNHMTNLLIWGGCTACRRVMPVPNDDTPVFERLENLKQLGV